MAGYLGGIEGEAGRWVILGEVEKGVLEMVRIQKRGVIGYDVGYVEENL